jgi:hypothetical protein
MKATIKTTIMLMAMTIGTLAASAQSANRGTPHNEQNRKSSRTSVSKSERLDTRSREQKAVRPNVSSKSTSQKTIVNRGDNGQRPSSASQRNSSARNDARKTSTTNHHNPKSDYRAPNRTVHAGKTYRDPKPRETNVAHKSRAVVEHNPGISHVHRKYYPAKKVRIHVHPVTYHNHYRAMYYPAHREIVWTHRMNRYYGGLYPGYTWRYPVGYHIQTISAFETRYNMGEVARVYGRVYGTWYNRETDDLLLFFGGEFPNQEFTMIVPGNVARRFNWRPERYFLGQHVYATGLITSFEGRPEMVVKKRSQLDIY